MAPGLPNYTKLNGGGGGGGGGGGSGVYGAVGVGGIPPSPPPAEKVRSSPTLFQMMSHDQVVDLHPQQQHQLMPPPFPAHIIQQQHQLLQVQQQQQMQIQQQQQSIVPVAAGMRPLSQPPHFQQQQQQQLQQASSLQDRVNAILFSPMISGLSSTFNDAASSDVKLTLIGRDGFSVTANVHTRVLIGSSHYFAAKLSDRSWVLKQPQRAPYSVEISDCEDVELYLLTIRLMYYSSSSGSRGGSSSADLKRVLIRENVSRVLGILKVASAIVFEAAVMACLDYLEAVPWSEDEEDKVLSLVSQLRPDYPAACRDVLKRLMESVLEEPESVLVRLLHSVIKATDDKARREMKTLVSKLLRENAAAAACSNSVIDVSKESLYEACQECLDALADCFAQGTGSSDQGTVNIAQGTGSIARHVDNLQWLADILIDRGLAEELVQMWAHQLQLAQLHGSLPAMQRHDASRITARLCVGIGRGQIMATQEVRGMLLRTWLHPLMDDFAWMQRLASKSGGSGLDRRTVEEGICQTVLTLALEEQRGILMAWFERYSRDGDDCPNLQRAFEVWWRRTFVVGTARQQDLIA